MMLWLCKCDTELGLAPPTPSLEGKERRYFMHDPIIPGPCPPGGCPPTTEIVCIETTKVYDFCFQVERRENVCFNLPESCHPDPGATAACEITNVNCTEVNRVPLTTPGFFNVTLLISVTANICIINPLVMAKTAAVRQLNECACEFQVSFSFTKTVTLCAPEGTDIDCEIPSFTCGPCVLTPAEQVCCTFILCVLIQQLTQLKSQVTNQSDQQQLTQQIGVLEQANQQLGASLQQASQGFSLLGWLFGLINR